LSDRVEGKMRRRRRSWYRRKLRIRRGLAFGLLVSAIAFVCWQNAARFLPLPAVHGSRLLPDSFATRNNLRQDLAWTPPHASQQKRAMERIPGVYPYSVVPGGIRDVESLRRAAATDRAIARHFAHFEYQKARLIRLKEARDVFVSYRIRDTMFWTRKTIRLHAGEMLLTDGKITARTKCGNQVSDQAKPEVSEEEPEEDILDQAVAISSMDPLSPARELGPAASLPQGQAQPPLFRGGGFVFPIVAIGGPPPEVCRFKNGKIDKKCHPRNPKAPEPSTMILLASGLGLVFWRYRSNADKGHAPA